MEKEQNDLKKYPLIEKLISAYEIAHTPSQARNKIKNKDFDNIFNNYFKYGKAGVFKAGTTDELEFLTKKTNKKEIVEKSKNNVLDFINMLDTYRDMLARKKQLEDEAVWWEDPLKNCKDSSLYWKDTVLTDTVKFFNNKVIPDTVSHFNKEIKNKENEILRLKNDLENITKSHNDLKNDIDKLKQLVKDSLCNEITELLESRQLRQTENKFELEINHLKDSIGYIYDVIIDTVSYFNDSINRIQKLIYYYKKKESLYDSSKIRGLSFTDSIEFEIGKYSIEILHEHTLNNILLKLKNNNKSSVLIAGFTDAKGSGLYNLILGEQRAKSVMLYFHERGIPLHRIKIISFGEISISAHHNSRKVKIYFIE
jgi:flagellar motor protein MotB